MMDCNIDMELLITLVENRPVLWDKTAEIYKNKHLNFGAWKEICVILKDNFETLSDKDKNEFGKHVVKKWSNARDNWMRCAKKLKEYKSGSGAKPLQKYKFYDQMQFLNKIVSHRPTATSMPLADDVEESQTAVKADGAVPKKRKKKELTQNEELGKRIGSLVDSVEKEDNSRIMSFFRGIAPTVEKFNDAGIVEFQYEVVKAMKQISQRTLSPPYSQAQSSHVSPNYIQTTTSAPYYLSQPSQTRQNIQQNSYGGCRKSSATKSNEIESNHSREFVLLNVRATSPTNTESVDSVDTADSQTVDYDFAKIPEFYDLLD